MIHFNSLHHFTHANISVSIYILFISQTTHGGRWSMRFLSFCLFLSCFFFWDFLCDTCWQHLLLNSKPLYLQRMDWTTIMPIVCVLFTTTLVQFWFICRYLLIGRPMPQWRHQQKISKKGITSRKKTASLLVGNAIQTYSLISPNLQLGSLTIETEEWFNVFQNIPTTLYYKRLFPAYMNCAQSNRFDT